MNANRARPLAAYALVTLACALVLAEGMRSDVGGSLGAAEGPTARPASVATASTVPGTVLRDRNTPTASASPTKLPRLALPGAASTAGLTSTSSGSGSTGSSAGSDSTPGVTLHGSTRPGKDTAAGNASPSGPTTDKADPGKSKGKPKVKKKGKAQAPGSSQNGHGKKPKGHGYGKAGSHAISLRWF